MSAMAYTNGGVILLVAEVTNDRMRQITGKHAWDLTKVLQSLVAQKLLVQEGSGRWTRYHLPSPPDSIRSGKQFIRKPDHSIRNEDQFIRKGGHSIRNEPDSIRNETDSIQKAEATDMAALRVIAQQAREKRRMKPANLDRIILQLCRNRYLTRQEIAELVQRNPDGLHTRNIKPMTDKGLLRMRHPDRPNRVDQAYQTVEESS